METVTPPCEINDILNLDNFKKYFIFLEQTAKKSNELSNDLQKKLSKISSIEESLEDNNSKVSFTDSKINELTTSMSLLQHKLQKQDEQISSLISTNLSFQELREKQKTDLEKNEQFIQRIKEQLIDRINYINSELDNINKFCANSSNRQTKLEDNFEKLNNYVDRIKEKAIDKIQDINLENKLMNDRVMDVSKYIFILLVCFRKN